MEVAYVCKEKFEIKENLKKKKSEIMTTTTE